MSIPGWNPLTYYRERYEEAVRSCRPLQSGGDLARRVGMVVGDRLTTTGIEKLCAALRAADARIKELEEAAK